MNHLSNCLNKLIEKIASIETNYQRKRNLKYFQWINLICSSDFNLISNLILCFQDESTDQSIKEKILHILLSLCKYKDDLIKEHFSFQSKFYFALTAFIDKTMNDKQGSMIANSLNLLIKMYKMEQYETLNDEKLIKRLFDTLQYVIDQKSTEDVIAILAGINATYKKNDENKVLKVYIVNENSETINELLLKLYYKETSHNKKMRTLLLINTLIANVPEIIFHPSDCELFIDSLLINIQLDSTDDHRYLILDTIEKISRMKSYYKHQYKIEDIIELMDDFKSSQYQPDYIKQTCRSIMINITQNLININGAY